jgi:WD40 repeat protein
MTPLARPGSRAILIGTGHHPPGAALRDIPAITPSLTDLALALEQQAGVPATNISLVLDPAGPAELAEQADQAAAAATDVLLVYFAGHGLLGEGADLYLATAATADPVRGLDYRALPYRSLLSIVRGSPARTIAIVLDCCFAGLAGSPTGPWQFDAILERAPLQGGVVLTAAARDAYALAAPGEPYTNFTGALIRLLRAGDPAGPRDLSIDHVYRYLSDTLPDQRPHLRSTDTAAALVLAPNPAYQPQAAWRPEQPPADVACPFRGLRPFGPQDARFFFGRDDMAGLVLARLESASGLVPLIGASGSGKTSLLRAGVVPALLSRGWTVAAMTPGTSPLATLAEHVASLAGRARPLLVIDQFEELFVGDGEQAGPFLAAVGAALEEEPFTVLAGLRADFYGQFLRHPFLAAAARAGQVVVPPLSDDELEDIIARPAEAAGLRLEEGLAETLLREAGGRRGRDQAAVLPLLSHALRETWQRRSGNLLTLAGYRDTGGISGAVARSAEEVYTALDGDGQRALRDLALRMVHLSADSEDTRRKLPLAELSPSERAVAGALAAARLATLDEQHAEFAHDSLLSAWPRLRGWIDESRVALVAASQLDQAAGEWERADRDDAYLYRELRLATTAAIIEDAPGGVPVSPRAVRFLGASRDHQRGEQRAARIRTLRRRAVLAAFCAVVVVAGVISAVSVHERQIAATRTAAVQSAELAADAESVAPIDPGAAAQLAVAAYRLSPTQDATTELYNLLNRPVDAVIGSFSGSAAERVAAQQDGPLVAAVDTKGQLEAWNLSDPSAPRLAGSVQAGLTGIALAPRQPLLAAGCGQQTSLCLWSLAGAGHPRIAARLPLPSHPGTVKITSMAFSPDGFLLAASAEEGFAMLWSVTDPGHPLLLGLLPDHASTLSLGAVAFSPDGRTLAQTLEFGSTLLWSLADPDRPVRAADLGTGYQDITFNAAGTVIAADSDFKVAAWNISPHGPPSVINVGANGGGSQDLGTLAFSPDGDTLSYGGIAATEGDTLGSLGTLATLDLSPAGIANDYGTLSPSASWDIGSGTPWMTYTSTGGLLTGGSDGTVRLWRLPGTAADAAAGSAQTVAFSTGATRLMVAPLEHGESEQTGIWDVSNRSDPVLESTLPFGPFEVAFLGSTSGLLVSSQKGPVQLWDLAHPRHPVLAASLGSVFESAGFAEGNAFSTNTAGTLESVFSSDGKDWLWRVSPGLRATRLGSVPVPAPTTSPVSPRSQPAPAVPALTPDGRTVIVLTGQGIQWWDVANPARPVRTSTSTVPGVSTGSIVATSGVLAAASQGSADQSCGCYQLQVFGISGGHVTSSVPIPDQTGDQLGISNDGRLLAAAGPGDNGLELWTVSDPRRPVKDASLATVPALYGIDISPDDTRLVDWNDGTLQLWDITRPADPSLLASVNFSDQPDNTGDASDVGTAVFAPSGPELAVSLATGVILVDTDPGTLAQQYCANTSQITRAEWTQYASNVPYLIPCPGG